MPLSIISPMELSVCGTVSQTVLLLLVVVVVVVTLSFFCQEIAKIDLSRFSVSFNCNICTFLKICNCVPFVLFANSS